MMEQEVAVALAYEPTGDGAPKILAAGFGEIARKIMAIAKTEGIHIHHDGTLAQLLARVPIGQEIPGDAYQLVAEILAFLYRTDRQMEEKVSASLGQNMPGTS